MVDDTPLPYAVAGALRFDDQAELDPRRYLLALAEQLVSAGGTIHERTRAVEVSEDERLTVKTPGARLTADHVIVATHVPFLDRSLAFARVTPMRSYLIACRIAGEPPAGMHISADGPTRSLRGVPLPDGEALLVGGEGHRTGDESATAERFARLEAFAREHWEVRAVNAPLVLAGRDAARRAAARRPRHAAQRAAAARHRLRQVGDDEPHGGGRAARRPRPGPTQRGRRAVRPVPPQPAHPAGRGPGGGGGTRGACSPARGRRADAVVADLAPGDGAIVTDGRRARRGATGGSDGSVARVAVAARTSGCEVRWNGAESSWDCPCHGSRFSPEGEVLHGPAVHRLESRLP